MKPDETPQQPVIDFLTLPETHGDGKVTRIDTHAATVFLSGGRALKIKRPVRFPFLDYSTLAKRKSSCEAEIEVNRPFAPAIYRGVTAITREPGGALALNGQGEPVEYAVDMARFDERQTLDHLAEAGQIDGALADRLGRAVAQAHKIAPVVDDAGFAETLVTIVEQNDGELRAGGVEIMGLSRRDQCSTRGGGHVLETETEGFIGAPDELDRVVAVKLST